MHRHSLSFLLFTALPTFVFAGSSDVSMHDLENRVKRLEQLNNCNANFNLGIQADALYLRASEDGLFYALKQKNSTFLNGGLKNVTYDWDFGFRLSTQYFLPHDDWDLFASWTHFYTKASNTSTTDEEDFDTNEAILQTWTDPLEGSPVEQLASHAKGSSHFHIDILNLDLGNSYLVSRRLFLHPFVGACGLWTHQTFSIDYKGNQLNFFKVAINLQNQFQGGGLRTGVGTEWYFYDHWSLAGNFACSLIYGRQSLHQNQRITSPAPSELTLSHTKNNWIIVKRLYDLSLALQWKQMFHRDRFCLGFQLGWEQHLLSGFNKSMNFLLESETGKFAFNQGDFALNGLFFHTSFDF